MIIDSSSLIIFAKINQLDLLLELYPYIFITHSIYDETVEQGGGTADALLIKDYVSRDKIIIKALNKNYKIMSMKLLKTYTQLGIGEVEALSLALQEKDKIIMDEKLGRQVCRLYNIQPVGSLRVLLDAYRNNKIDEKELKRLVGEMLKNGFRISGEVINEFWSVFEKLKMD